MLLCAPGGVKDVQSIISDYFGDQDPRVRTAAIKATVGHCQNLHFRQKPNQHHTHEFWDHTPQLQSSVTKLSVALFL